MITLPVWACFVAAVAGFALLAFERFGNPDNKPSRIQSGIVFLALFGGVANLFAHFAWYWAVALVVLCFGAGNGAKLFLDDRVKPLSWLAPLAVVAGLWPQYMNLR